MLLMNHPPFSNLIDNHKVVINYTSPRSAVLADKIVQEIASLPHEPLATSISGDIRSCDGPADVVAKTIEWLGAKGKGKKIDILINNAGVEVVKPLGSITSDDFNYV
jgi:3-oxoacyl-[acyl-carrier protein] reductase